MTHYLLGSTLTLRNAKEDDLENALAKLEGAFRVYLDATEGLDTERAKKRKPNKDNKQTYQQVKRGLEDLVGVQKRGLIQRDERQKMLEAMNQLHAAITS